MVTKLRSKTPTTPPSSTKTPNTDRQPIHCVVYGDSGAGKSTFAATFPKPMLVLLFDPPDKATPYFRRGAVQSHEWGAEVIYADRRTIRVEYYHDRSIGKAAPKPSAYRRFRERVDDLFTEYREWKTIVIDSLTFMELAARKNEQYVLNPTSRDPRQWYAGSTETLEEMLLMVFSNLSTNVVCCAHIDEKRDEVHGNMIYNPALPGRLSRRLPAGYGELYRAYVARDDEENLVHRLQTRATDEYNASSQIQAPDPCVPLYQSLW